MGTLIRGSPRRLVVLGAGALLLTVALAAGLWMNTRREFGSVRGVLLDVQSRSLVLATQVTLRDEAGQTWTFDVDPEVATNGEEPQSASHLRVHMALGEPMIVRYRLGPDGPVAVRILDAQ